jgi:hypothetical protein
MSTQHRRQFLKDLLSALVQSAGAVVVACAAAPAAMAPAAAPRDPQERADQLPPAEEAADGTYPVDFVNRAFRNGGGFRNGGFANGGFRNGGFRNGGFANSGFRNGGFRNF